MKKKLKYQPSLFLLFIVSTNFLFAQNFKEDYKLISVTYSNVLKFSCDLKIEMFTRSTQKQASETMTSSIKKMGENYLYDMGNNKMLMNSKCIVSLNEESKQIIYSLRNKKNEMQFQQGDAMSTIDSLVKKSDSVIFLGLKNDEKKYVIYSSKMFITKTEMSINVKSNTITEVVYYYDIKKNEAGEKVIIKFLNINLSPSFKETDFSEKQFVIVSKNTIVATPKYSNYKVLVIDLNDIK